jgi:uncharacterized protein YndB with AHSA1/START domain
MPDILHLLKIRVPPQRVYAALTSPAAIRNWWTGDADLDAQVRGVGEFRFSHQAAVVTQVRITELAPRTRVAWEVTASVRPEWIGTSLTFELRPQGGDTILAFARHGFAAADAVFAMTTTGWGYYLVSLQQYLERGTGAPSPDVDFSRIIG